MRDTKISSKSADQAGTAYLSLLLTFFLWGSLYVVSKFVLDKLPSFTIAFFRFVLAFMFLTVLERVADHRSASVKRKLERKHFPYVILIGFGGYFIAVGAQLLGTKYAGASTASLLNSMNPVTISVFGAILLSEKLTARKIVGILLSVAGVIAILGGGIQGTSIPGILLSLFAVLFWSYVSVMTRKITREYNPLYISRLACGVAAICYMPVAAGQALITKAPVVDVLIHDVPCTLGLVYMGIMCTGVAYLLWNRSLSVLDAGTCAAFYPLQPAVSTLFGILLLGEKINAGFVIGAGLIVLGVLISLGIPGKPSRRQDT